MALTSNYEISRPIEIIVLYNRREESYCVGMKHIVHFLSDKTRFFNLSSHTYSQLCITKEDATVIFCNVIKPGLKLIFLIFDPMWLIKFFKVAIKNSVAKSETVKLIFFLESPLNNIST